MRTVVTGGAGFLGSHLCEKFIDLGHEVVAIDNLLTGSEHNISGLKAHPRFEFIKHDIAKGFPEIGSVDYIYHLASPASPKDFVALSREILEVGSLATFACCDYARRYNGWMLLASTSEVYGDPLVHPQDEDYLGNVDCNSTRGVYDESKRFSEAVITSEVRKGLKASIVRIFNTYGPRMRRDDGRVITNFIVQAMENQDITLYGDGSQTRSFCYVDDLIEGLYRFSQVQPLGPINLGNDREIPIRDVAHIIKNALESSSRIVEGALPERDPKLRQPLLQRADEILKWQPKVSFEDGLKKTIAYFSSLK